MITTIITRLQRYIHHHHLPVQFTDTVKVVHMSLHHQLFTPLNMMVLNAPNNHLPTPSLQSLIIVRVLDFAQDVVLPCVAASATCVACSGRPIKEKGSTTAPPSLKNHLERLEFAPLVVLTPNPKPSLRLTSCHHEQ